MVGCHGELQPSMSVLPHSEQQHDVCKTITTCSNDISNCLSMSVCEKNSHGRSHKNSAKIYTYIRTYICILFPNFPLKSKKHKVCVYLFCYRVCYTAQLHHCRLYRCSLTYMSQSECMGDLPHPPICEIPQHASRICVLLTDCPDIGLLQLCFNCQQHRDIMKAVTMTFGNRTMQYVDSASDTPPSHLSLPVCPACKVND